MTAEEVLNVNSKEISDNGEDHHKIVTENCNADVHGKEISVNGNVNGVVVSDSVDSDPIVTVTVDGNGNGNSVVLDDYKVEGESKVTDITEEESCVVYNSSVDTAKVDVVENGSGSDENNGDDSEFISVQNGVLDKRDNECVVESVGNEIREEVVDSSVEEEGVKVEDGELESVWNGDVAENEICVVVDDVEKSDRELGDVVVENGTVDREEVDGEEIKVPDVVEEVDVASTELVESVDSGVVGNSESNDRESEKSGNVVGVDVLEEKNEICEVELESGVGVEASVSAEKNGIRDVELESAVDNGVSESAEKNGTHDVELESVVDYKVSESAEKNGTHDADLESAIDDKVSESPEKNETHDVELESAVDNGVSESAEKNGTHDVELESVVDYKVSESSEKNGTHDADLESAIDDKVSESPEKNETHDVELESAVDNKVSESAEKNETRDVELESVVDNEVSESAQKNKTQDVELESVVGGEVSEPAEKNETRDVELESVVDNEVSESAEKNKTRDVELESVVGGGEVSESAEKNGVHNVELETPVDNKVSESAENNETHEVELESVVGGEVSESAEKNETRDVELESVVDNKVSESAEKNKTRDVELESVVEAEVSESVEKNDIPVDVNGVCDNTDVKECAVEVTQNGLENALAESVSDNGLADVEKSDCTEENVIPVDAVESERSVDISEPQVVLQGKNSADLIKSGISDDVNEGGNENEPSVDTKNIEEETQAEPSDNVVKDEGESVELPELKNDAVESKVEPSTETVENKAEVSNDVVQTEAEVLNNVVQSEADPSVEVQDLKTDAVESEAEPLVEAEPSAAGEVSNQIEDDSKKSQEASATDAIDAQSMDTEVVRKPFYYLIRVPRYDDDEKIKEQIQHAAQQLEEKNKIRDEIRAEIQTKQAICKEYDIEFRAAVQEERVARDLLKSKRQEMDSVQSTMSRLNNAISVVDIDSKIRNMEHMIQHETLPLKEEKQLIRQIKQLKQSRGELSNIIAKQNISQPLDDKDSIEEQSKQLQLLRKELDVLRSKLLKAETITQAAKKKYGEESNKLSEVLARHNVANDIRQEAFVKWQTLKRQLHEKSNYFWEYKNASKKAHELGIQGKKEEVQSLCIDQAERIHEMWKNDEFRRYYIRCNTRSTLWRLQTFDGRMLGPDEDPPVIPPNDFFTERTSKNESLVPPPTPEQQIKSIPTESATVKKKDEHASKVVAQKPETSHINKAKKSVKPTPSEKKSAVPVSRWGDESDEDKEPVRTKEEEEQILKAEKARKEEEERILKAEKARKEKEEAKLKEMKRLEEIEKAKEAQQRKKRNAEKAQQRALYKAQKEAEQKEKEREKRARKKGKRKAVATADDAVANTEQDAAASPSSATLPKATEESDQIEKPVEVTKRPVKPSQFTKQNKAKSLPMAIRNRGKRRIQPWMWWALIAVLVVAALFYMGNNSSLRSSFQSFGF